MAECLDFATTAYWQKDYIYHYPFISIQFVLVSVYMKTENIIQRLKIDGFTALFKRKDMINSCEITESSSLFLSNYIVRSISEESCRWVSATIYSLLPSFIFKACLQKEKNTLEMMYTLKLSLR